ncbi:MAG: GGDEF domain-containing protein [Betaproteobacteria bacterium]|nr:MAG: GGDEF domain-containing protein [Betaproteobacteria bacterium]
MAVDTVFGRWLSRQSVPSRPPSLDAMMASGRAREGLLDLAKRGDRGIFVHLPLWFLIAIWTELWAQHPLFCVINALIFGANAIARLMLRQRFGALVERDYRSARNVFLALLLANCVHWGVLTGLAMHFTALRNAEVPLLFASVGVGCSGALGLAISPHTLLALMSMVLVAYLYKASRIVHDDYWAAADARFDLEERARQLELLSVTDALTQIHNRLYFEHRLVAEWSRASRDAKPLSVLIVDLDHFKVINDTYGHPFGDRCLVAAAKALRDALHRTGDVLARYGGEEFAVLLPGADALAARGVAERLLHSVSEVQLTHDAQAVHLACSIGVSTLVPAPQSSPSSAVSRADKALYQAKQQGRNRVVIAPA